MRSFYTNVAVWGSRILYRGIDNGKRIRKTIDYFPTLYTPSNQPTEYKTVRNEYVQEIKPGNIRECRDFVKRYDGVEGFRIYGNQKYEYAFIAENYFGDIEWDRNLVTICNIDIEVGSNKHDATPSKKVKIRKKQIE